MEKSKIDWCDSTWNPVTGCMHECEYCYARKIAERFEGTDSEVFDEEYRLYAKHELDKPLMTNGRKAPYPYGFAPTLHRYRLNNYIGKKGRNIFVCSMADLFGEWVPDSWIEEVFKACEKAPQHNYMFLTKNPGRYAFLGSKAKLPYKNNMWYGYSYTGMEDGGYWNADRNVFVSIEPLLKPVEIPPAKWIIIGAETGRRKDKVVPERKWIENIVDECRKENIPVFMKSSLATGIPNRIIEIKETVMANKLCSTREILFRGKRTDNGEWAEGLPGYDANGNITNIEVFRGYSCCYLLEVHPKTICQYTGLTDKNGRKIWENDRCRVGRTCVLAYGVIKCFEGCFCFVEDGTGNILRLCDVRTNGYDINIEGNIFDNPELIEQGDDAE